MKHQFFLIIILFFQGMDSYAQVGINKQNPTATLDVSGNVLVREKLYLEDPGQYNGEGDSKFLMINNQGEIIRFNLANGSYGPLNYVQMVFKKTSSFGLDQGYNTKISASKYKLAVHGFYFNNIDQEGVINANYTLRKTSGYPYWNRSRYIEGHQFYAYIGGPTGNRTWYIKGFINDSQFYLGNNSGPQTIDIYMDVLIYRNDFITKFGATNTVIDLNQMDTATAPLPFGF